MSQSQLQTTIHACASEGLIGTGAEPQPERLTIVTDGDLHMTYGALREMETKDVLFSLGKGKYADCWFGPNQEGPYSDLIITTELQTEKSKNSRS